MLIRLFLIFTTPFIVLILTALAFLLIPSLAFQTSSSDAEAQKKSNQCYAAEQSKCQRLAFGMNTCRCRKESPGQERPNGSSGS